MAAGDDPQEELLAAQHISKFDSKSRSEDVWVRAKLIPVAEHGRELFYGLIRIHVLVHAVHEPIFGLAMMQELGRHGYRIGPGTLYPLLHGLERAGLIKSFANPDGSRRRMYRITAAGRRALARAKEKVDELHHELHEAHPRMRQA
jgi:PadR family transcriptional regulator, regulatory protein PadR